MIRLNESQTTAARTRLVPLPFDGITQSYSTETDSVDLCLSDDLRECFFACDFRAPAMFAAFLSRYSGEDAVAVETIDSELAVAGTIVADLSGEPSFRQIAERLEGAAQRADDTLTNVAFVRNAAVAPGRPLSLLAVRGGAVSLQYQTAAFERSTIERMCANFETFCAGLLERPDVSVFTVPLLAASQRRTILQTFNDTRRPFDNRGIHQFFEDQALWRPDATALVFGDCTYTYARLNARANQLARNLYGQVETGALVGICMQRCPDMVAAMLAVLKCGGAYVPLDPAWPQERVAFMLEDARCSTVFCDRTVGETLSGFRGLRIDATAVSGSGEEKNLDLAVDPAGDAYIIYTSGSTGKPKGARLTHRNAANLIEWGRRLLPRSSFDGVLASTSICFDVSIFELFVTFAVGGTAVLVQDILELRRVRGHPITLVNSVASAFSLLARTNSIPATVRSIMQGGELFRNEVIQQIYAQSNVERIINCWGPTETTTYSTSCLVPRHAAGNPPIGHPIDNTQAYIVDEKLQPVPIGVAGEIYLSGVGLGSGYLHRPDLTSERFIDNPFEPGTWLYRTGDIGRFRADGAIEFLRRNDDQIKVRGFRVELGEIETALARCPNVRECAVSARDDKDGVKQLNAYVSMDDGSPALTLQEMRSALGRGLPHYMIPSTLTVLPALPHTPSGKIDRLALPVAKRSAAKGIVATKNARHDAAQTRQETEICRIFAEVLSLERIAPTDNFFDCGGQSLLAMQAAVRISETLGCELRPRALFDAPTARQLAALAFSRGTVDLIPARPQIVPASASQRSLWLIDRLLPATAVYTIEWRFDLRGGVDPAMVGQALVKLLRRHDALRTTFSTVDGGPVQVVNPFPQRVELPFVDLRDGDEQESVQAIVRRESRLPFDLRSGPLYRFHLVQLADRYALLVFLHHTIADGWSMDVLARDLAALCADEALPPLELQFADFAWREHLRAVREEKNTEECAVRLRDLPVVQMPSDRPRPPAVDFSGERETLVLPSAVARRLEDIAKTRGATLAMAMLAAFAIVIQRHTGEDDIPIGSVSAGRPSAEAENVVGFFANTVVYRNDLSGAPAFVELLDRVRADVLCAWDHQGVPFDRLVEKLMPQRALNVHPLFQLGFVMQQHLPERTAGSIRIASQELHTRTAKFDLTLEVTDRPGGLTLALEYATAMYDASTAKRLLEHVALVMEAVAGAPEVSIGSIVLASPDAKPHDATVPRAGSGVIHERFGAQAAATPAAIALSIDADELTYEELDRESNRVARFLHERSLGRGSFVPILFERSFEMIVAILGVLKAGAAYVPLDPQLPQSRLERIVRNVGAGAVLAQPAFAQRVLDIGARPLLLDDARLPSIPDDAVDSGVEPDDVAYVIHTSGSTGDPKGVLVTHGNVTQLLDATAKQFGFSAQDVWSVFHSYAFDFSVWELWGALLYGARAVLVPAQTARSPQDYYELVRERGITVVNQTPSAFKAWLSVDAMRSRERIADSVRLVILGGERLSLDALRPWFARPRRAGARVFNMYGITETTVHVTAREIHAADCEDRRSLIGRPLAHLHLHLLDGAGRPVPLGATGEVHVAGGGVSRGYLHDAQRTGERFVPDTICGRGLMYRSGDLCRRHNDGELEYLGRSDQQVKIRGFRVEPGEVESALRRCEYVEDAAVLVDGDANDPRLISYVAARGDIDEVRLRSDLKEMLADYMVPARFVFVEHIPLGANGKTDARALSLMLAENTATPADDIHTVSALELELLDMCRALVHRPDVAASDNFFNIGGHSLLAARLLTRIEERFGVHVALATFFARPTIADLAQAVQAQTAATGCDPLVAVNAAGTKLPFFFAHGYLQGDGFYCWPLARALGSDRPFYAIAPHGADGAQIPETIEEMAAERLQRIQEIQPHGPYALGGFCNGALMIYEIARRLVAQGERVETLVLMAAGANNRRFAPLYGALSFAGRIAGWNDSTLRRLFVTIRYRWLRLAAALGAGVAAPGKLLRMWRHRRETAPPESSREASYGHIVAAYIPKPYPGSLTLIWPDGDDALQGPRARNDWNGLAAGVDLHVVGGEHLDFISRSFEEVASIVKEALDGRAG